MCDDCSDTSTDTSCDTSDTTVDTSSDTTCDTSDTTSELPEDSGDLSDDGSEDLPEDDYQTEDVDMSEGDEELCDTESEADEVSDDGSETLPDESADEVSDDGSESLPDESVDEVPDDGSEALPDENVDEVSDDGSEALPNENVDEVPDDGSEALPDENMDEVPDDGSEALPDDKVDETPNDGSDNFSENNDGTTSLNEGMFGYRKGDLKNDINDGKDLKNCAPQLRKTKQDMNTVINDVTGEKETIFDHPDDLAKKLPYSQGNNDYDKDGTCGLAQTAVNLQKAGVNATENSIVDYASHNKMEDGTPLCSETGGTNAYTRKEIWDHCGMPADIIKNGTMDDLAKHIESGKAVSVGVNAGVLWSQDNPEKFDYDGQINPNHDCFGDLYADGRYGSNHVVSPVSTYRNEDGSLGGFFVNDTGRGYERDACRRVPVGDFERACNVNGSTFMVSKKAVW